MPIEVFPVPLPASADASKFADFGRIVKGVDAANLSPEEFIEVEELLYKHSVLLFRDCNLPPEAQYKLTKAFDPSTEIYGHGNNKTEKTRSSILHYLKTMPSVPQVQLIGNGTVYNHEGFAEAKLTHPHHKSFHKTKVSDEDEAKGVTRFNRWHMDAALYDLSAPKITTLYAVKVPVGNPQICRYDDGTGDELQVPLATTAFVSGKTMFDILPAQLKSVAVRSTARYAPHPYVWMSPAHAMSTGLGMETEGLEVKIEGLPTWEEDKIKRLPMLWKNPKTGDLHFQTHPCAIQALEIAPLPKGVARDDALYPDGASLTDLREVRGLLYKMQRPAIAPNLVYPHDWKEKDLVIFHNRGVMHTVVGTLTPNQIRVFHQCNLAASDDPVGPDPEEVLRYT